MSLYILGYMPSKNAGKLHWHAESIEVDGNLLKQTVSMPMAFIPLKTKTGKIYIIKAENEKQAIEKTKKQIAKQTNYRQWAINMASHY